MEKLLREANGIREAFVWLWGCGVHLLFFLVSGDGKKRRAEEVGR
jgi:hypothetical protein